MKTSLICPTFDGTEGWNVSSIQKKENCILAGFTLYLSLKSFAESDKGKWRNANKAHMHYKCKIKKQMFEIFLSFLFVVIAKVFSKFCAWHFMICGKELSIIVFRHIHILPTRLVSIRAYVHPFQLWMKAQTKTHFFSYFMRYICFSFC